MTLQVLLRCWSVCVLSCWLGSAWAADGPLAGFDPLADAEEAAKEVLPEDQAAIDARLKQLQAKQGEKHARVIVLKWPDTDTGEKNLLLQALVRNTIGRPDAKLFPGMDLYQEGRRRRFDRGVPVAPGQQPGSVPDDLLEHVASEVRKARAQLGSSMANEAVAGKLLRLADELWFNDRPEIREVLFDLYATIGQAVYLAREQTPPYYQMVGGDHANYYLYLAAAMLWEERQAGVSKLESRKPRGELGDVIEDLIGFIDQGAHPPIPVAFHDGGLFDAKAFTRDHKLLVNGLERIVDDTGVVMVPRGRVDLSLERSRGFGMSERVEVVRLDEKIYFAVEVAKQKMGYDLLNQLMVHPEECTPYLRRDTLGSIATYAALHPTDEIYLAIPKLGSVRDLYIWRYDRTSATLHLLLDRNKGFPVRFAALASAGMGFSGGSLDTSTLEEASNVSPEDVQGGALPSVGVNPEDLLQLDPAYVPIDFQLRGHFNRLMFGFGLTFGKNIAPNADGVWTERYQTDGNLVVRSVPAQGADPLLDPDASEFEQALMQRDFNRLIYGFIGVVLLKDAPYGMGPRAYLRFGGMNAPHVLDISGHIGITEEPTFGKRTYRGRVIPILDLDLYAGAWIPYGDTLLRDTSATPDDDGNFPVLVLPNLGFTLGVGFTF